jgi:hypothetical protein
MLVELRHSRVSGSESSNPRSQSAGAAAGGSVLFKRTKRIKPPHRPLWCLNDAWGIAP